jgi:NAD(P)-dependent dehydrogenase (short-subunit alcohol dehydrogenase family)
MDHTRKGDTRMGKYAGKKAVVTGGTSGLGLAIAGLLRDQGAEVLVTGRSEPNLTKARDALGKGAHVVRSDMASLADIATLSTLVQQKLGAIDALFVNAGYCKMADFAEVSESEYDRTFATNTKGRTSRCSGSLRSCARAAASCSPPRSPIAPATRA